MNKTKIPSLITVLILTLITSFMWIGFSVYRAFATKPSPSVPEEVSKPLTPTLDKTAIDKIEGRISISEGEIPTTTIVTVSPTPTPLATPTPTPTPIESPTVSPAATLSP